MPGTRVVIDRNQLEVDGRKFPLAEIRGAAAEPRTGSVLWPSLIGGFAGVGVIPALIVMLGRSRAAQTEQWLYVGLFVAAVALFASIGKLLFSGERYCLVLETAHGCEVAFESDDLQLVSNLVARLNDHRARAR